VSRPRTPAARCGDIPTAAGQAERFVAGLSYDQFVANDLVVFAVVRALEVVGEASRRLPPEVRGLAADGRRQDIIGLRNKLALDYIHVDYVVVWQVVQTDRLAPPEAAP
jgi:uncharacterized protein with HEPN domain